MNKIVTGAVIALAALTLTACGDQTASSPQGPEPTGTEAPPIPTLAPSEQQEVVTEVIDDLSSLAPPDDNVRGALLSGESPIDTIVNFRDCAEVSAWLHLPIVAVDAVGTDAATNVRACATTDAPGPLPDRQAKAPDGGPLSGAAFLFTAPVGTDFQSMGWTAALQAGVAISRIEWGTGTEPITQRATKDATDPAGGYVTTMVGDTIVNIQNLGDSTRIAYTKTVDTEETYLVSVELPPSTTLANFKQFAAGENIS